MFTLTVWLSLKADSSEWLPLPHNQSPLNPHTGSPELSVRLDNAFDAVFYSLITYLDTSNVFIAC